MQSWKGSILESWVNIAIGFAINFAANVILLPFIWNPAAPAKSAFIIGVWFTLISQVRQLLIRRVFNRITLPWNVEKPNANS